MKPPGPPEGANGTMVVATSPADPDPEPAALATQQQRPQGCCCRLTKLECLLTTLLVLAAVAIAALVAVYSVSIGEEHGISKRFYTAMRTQSLVSRYRDELSS